MTEQRPDPKPAIEDQPKEGSPETAQPAEDQPKVTRRMSVEEHLAGLWKVLGLGD